MIPAFEIEGGLWLAMARGASVAGLMATAGGLIYAAWVRPAGLPALVDQRLRRVNGVALALAGLAAVAWLALQCWAFAGDLSPGDLWATLSATQFGHLLAARLGLLALAGLALWGRRAWLACGASVAALCLQAGHSHAVAMGEPVWLVGVAVLHVLAAGLWLGALPALWVVLRAAPDGLAASAARRFSVPGLACAGVLLATACVQFDLLVVDVPGLVGTAYGWMVGLKIALFLVLLGLAARNRRVLTPLLGCAASAPGRLRRAVMAEIVLGMVVVAAAGVLSELQPAMHVQKLWPFAWLPSFEAAGEDADILREVSLAAAATLGGVVLLVAGVFAMRRRAWSGAGAGLAGTAMVWLAVPHLSPLVVPAVPTEFYHSPSGFTAASVQAGAALYGPDCAACHGATGHGDGPAGRALAVPPADLTAAHLWMHSDGELFWWLTHGMSAPGGAQVMPGFARLDEDERWALIDFIRARNAGLTLDATGAWATPVQAPDFAIDCGAGPTRLSALRGRLVRLVLAPTVAVQAAGSQRCAGLEPRAEAAYAVVAPGAGAVLIDAKGWLRGAAHDLGGLQNQAARAATPLSRPPPLPMDMNMNMNMKM